MNKGVDHVQPEGKPSKSGGSRESYSPHQILDTKAGVLSRRVEGMHISSSDVRADLPCGPGHRLDGAQGTNGQLGHGRNEGARMLDGVVASRNARSKRR